MSDRSHVDEALNEWRRETRRRPSEPHDKAIHDDSPLLEEPPWAYEPPGELIHVANGRAAEAPVAPLIFKTAATFAGEYVPLAYTIEPFLRSSSLYALTARTGAGKTGFLVVAMLAVATGRADILGREVTQGRVAYLACENPDDIRMRLMIAAYLLNIDLRSLGDNIVILDRREKPEAVHAALAKLAEEKPFRLIIVDTLAAFFDGDNINDAVQGGQFMRRLRPLTQIAGQPSVIVAAHPVKNASEDNLVPYGSGAILNELDGNLTLWKKPDSGIVSLHWQGKLRGLEFEPAPFRFEVTGCPEILDAKGREVHLPTMRPASEESAENREQQETDGKRALLLEMISNPGASQADYATALGCSKSSINRRLQSFARERLAEQFLDKWKITERGRKCVE
ncbi:MAG: AAA family ATPase [Methylocystis sp.]